MATTMTLAQARAEVRRRADMVNSTFVTDPEIDSYLNQSYFELYDLMISKYGDNYFVAPPHQFTTDGTASQYDLPADFYKLLGVDLSLTGGADGFVSVKPFNFADRNRYSVPNFQSFYGVTNLRYRINGSKIWFTPLPSAGQVIQLWYVPRMTTLAADGDTFDGISGWTEYPIVDAAIKCLQKEESDVTVLMAQKQALKLRLEGMAENRDAGSPATVVDMQNTDSWFPYGSGGGPY